MSGDHPREAWLRLGDAVRRRRDDLGHTQATLAAAGGPSATIISRIERAAQTSYGARVLMRLERTLRWERGSVEAILGGGEATPATARPATGGRYPSFVDDDFLRWIWDYPEPDATLRDRRIAIAAVRADREIRRELDEGGWNGRQGA